MKNSFIMASLIICVTAVLFFQACGERSVSGIIDRETRWKAEDGPYIVEGDLLITRMANLVIAQGTRIIIKSGTKTGFLTKPFDKADSTLFSIRVLGSISCVGRRSNPIVITPERTALADYSWRGIILDEADSRYTEIAFTEISGAAAAITVKNSNSLLRNNALENSNIGIHCVGGGQPKIYNNLISSCFTAGIKIENSNPQIVNNIIVFNNNAGLWCDDKSKIVFKYNCVFGNTDRNFLDCDPDLGKLARGVKNRDSTDAYGNIVADPIFMGSEAEARAIDIDILLQTDSTKVENKKILHIPNLQFRKPTLKEATTIGSETRQLSKYSPCINAGDPGGSFKNVDGTRNTMGPKGGQDFMSK
ncbi:MAG: right-handed parallel beta-helix repeat-containing protein [Chitinispirillales bacterium]|jgi:parallel beta-helix repeat protein|nr:right-handed parallel beta-helix repeat-containing protein [Chitinispirillales bacterium]